MKKIVSSVSYGKLDESKMSPNFDNREAWVSANPYAQSGNTGQCTWFAWGGFYEIYGYDSLDAYVDAFIAINNVNPKSFFIFLTSFG